MSTNSIGYPDGTQATPLPRSRASGQHYRRPEERPFTAAERETTTILIGGLTAQARAVHPGGFSGLRIPLRGPPDAGPGGLPHRQGIRQQRPVQSRLFHRRQSDPVFERARAGGLSRQRDRGPVSVFHRGLVRPLPLRHVRRRVPAWRCRTPGFDGFRVIRFQQDDGIKQKVAGARSEVHDRFRRRHAENALHCGCAERPDPQHSPLRGQSRGDGPGYGTLRPRICAITSATSRRPSSHEIRAGLAGQRSWRGTRLCGQLSSVLYKFREHLYGGDFQRCFETLPRADQRHRNRPHPG